jgi:hypothetical protein
LLTGAFALCGGCKRSWMCVSTHTTCHELLHAHHLQAVTTTRESVDDNCYGHKQLNNAANLFFFGK